MDEKDLKESVCFGGGDEKKGGDGEQFELRSWGRLSALGFI